VARDVAQMPFDDAARGLKIDWRLETTLDGKQVQRWGERLGEMLVQRRTAEIEAAERGIKPEAPANAPQILVIGMDGGRVHMREKGEGHESFWHENKVGSVTSYIPGEGEEKPAQALVTTIVATMARAAEFGAMIELESRRRGLAKARLVLNISDGGNWIDPLDTQFQLSDFRIVDYYHAAEHLHDVAKSVHGPETAETETLWEKLKGFLWEGQLTPLLAELRELAAATGTLDEAKAATRAIITKEIGYFEKHTDHMRYDVYRRNGWPIGSGNTEAAVKTFNKRVKGTEQRWSEAGVEAVMALRAHWKSQDQRWERHWANAPAYPAAVHKAAA
jgi:hypothetical protein